MILLNKFLQQLSRSQVAQTNQVKRLGVINIKLHKFFW